MFLIATVALSSFRIFEMRAGAGLEALAPGRLLSKLIGALLG